MWYKSQRRQRERERGRKTVLKWMCTCTICHFDLKFLFWIFIWHLMLAYFVLWLWQFIAFHLRATCECWMLGVACWLLACWLLFGCSMMMHPHDLQHAPNCCIYAQQASMSTLNDTKDTAQWTTEQRNRGYKNMHERPWNASEAF